jgi:methionyl-tRNA formyltransferase
MSVLPEWMTDQIVPRPQDPRLASLAPRLATDQGLVEWERDASAIALHVRAMNPWPCAHTALPDGRRLKILVAAVAAVAAPVGATPGQVLPGPGDALVVACGVGALRLDVVQPAGKRAMTGADFLRGTRNLVGQRLGGVAVLAGTAPR